MHRILYACRLGVDLSEALVHYYVRCLLQDDRLDEASMSSVWQRTAGWLAILVGLWFTVAGCLFAAGTCLI